MTSVEFCYWLQGYFEISGLQIDSQLPKALDCLQVQTIQRHLALVFAHDIDPKAGNQEHQEVLNKIHNPKNDDPIYRC